MCVCVCVASYMTANIAETDGDRERERGRERGRDRHSWRCGLDAEGETQAVRGRGASVRDWFSISILRVPGAGVDFTVTAPLCLSL